MKLKTLSLVIALTMSPVLAQMRGPARVPLPVDLSETLKGIEYKIRVPANWNGTLLVFAHETQWGPPVAQVAPVAWPTVEPPLEEQLLALGYALAGAGYPTSPEDGILSTLVLTTLFRGRVGNPSRTMIWGNSLGGLVALKLIEKFPGIYNGAIANCAPVAGDLYSVDWALAFGLAYAAAYEWPSEVWGPIEDLHDDLDLFTDVVPVAHWPENYADFGKWEFMRRVLQIPPEAYWTSYPENPGLFFFGGDLWKATEMRANLEKLAGGPVSQNVGVVYTLPQKDIDELLDMGVDAEGLLAKMNARTDITAARRTRLYLKHWAEPSGNIRRPVLTMHNICDGTAVIANETVYANRVAEKGNSERLVQAYVRAIPGHCTFSAEQYLSVLFAMESWLETGLRPDAELLPGSEGFDLNYVPPPWPLPASKP